MKRESFPFMTMRQMVTGLDLARQRRRYHTSSEAFRAPFLRELQPQINQRAIGVELEKEKRRFLRQNQALERGRQRVTMARLKLLATKQKNERLMELRQQLQKQRWLEPGVMSISPVSKPGSSHEPRKRRTRSYRAVRVRRV